MLAAKRGCDAEFGLPIGWRSDLSDWALLVWAGNLFFMSSRAEDLRRRCQAYEQAPRGLEHHFAAKSLDVLPKALVP